MRRPGRAARAYRPGLRRPGPLTTRGGGPGLARGRFHPDPGPDPARSGRVRGRRAPARAGWPDVGEHQASGTRPSWTEKTRR
jgi:hypothetical protein